jgi:hypothetical protein
MPAPILVLAGKWAAERVVGEVCSLLITHGAGYLSETEVERVSKALSAAIAEVAPPVNRRERFLQLFRRGKPVQGEMTQQFTASAVMELGARTGSEQPRDWRVPLEDALKAAALNGLASDGDVGRAWGKIVPPARGDGGADQRATQWAFEVRRIFELKLAADQKARVLLARLDWGSEQATRIAVAESLEDIRTSMRNIALAVTGIAGGVAVVVEILTQIKI